MAMVEMVCIEGLDEAILGTAFVNGEEVIAYDAEVAEQLVLFMEYGSLYDFVESIGLEDLGVNAPIFVYQDEGMRLQLGEIMRRSVH